MITSYLLPALWASSGGWPERRSFLSASLGVTHITASAGGRLGLARLLASSHAWAPGPLSTWSLVLHEASLGFFPRAAPSEEGKRGNFRASPGLGPEVRQRHFCSILLVKASHEAGPDSKGRDIHFMAQWKVDEVLLQRGVYDRMGEKNLSHFCKPSTIITVLNIKFLSHLSICPHLSPPNSTCHIIYSSSYFFF